MTIDEAKQRLRIPELWRRLELPGEPRSSCRSPLREDHNASFSVSADGLLFHDFATDEAGDAIDFLRLATGLSPDAACRKFLEMAGRGVEPLRALRPAQRPTGARQRPVLPAIERGTDEDLQAVAALRGVSFTACKLARIVGLLQFATIRGNRAWLVTDDERVNVQARRLDGKPWEHISAKAYTLPGCWASWPLGIKKAWDYPCLLLVEGGPDLLAGMEFILRQMRTADACRIDRIGRGPVLLESPCLSTLWLTQPDKVESLLAERSLTDGGLIPRMLICHTKCEPLEIVDDTPPIPEDVASNYRELIQTLVRVFKLSAEVWTIEPSPEAAARMMRHFNATVKRRRGELRDVTSFAARWTENAWRVAVSLHAAKWGAKANEQPLDDETAEDAISIVDWFSRQQLEILSAGREKVRRDKRDEVLALLADHPTGITKTHVRRKRITGTPEEALALLAEMEEAGELIGRDEKPESGGHVTRIFTQARKRR